MISFATIVDSREGFYSAMETNNNQFLQFSDQLRHQTSGFANLSLNDSIWSGSYGTKRAGERRNFDIRVGGGEFNSPEPKPAAEFNNSLNNDGWNGFKPSAAELNSFDRVNDGWNSFKPPKVSEFNGFNDWKMGNPSGAGINGGFNKGVYSKTLNTHNFNTNDFGLKSHRKGGKNEDVHGGKSGKKAYNGNKKSNNGDNNGDNKESKNGSDKRFKTLPPSESLPRNETVGGYIFVCNNDTMQENLKRELFGMCSFS